MTESLFVVNRVGKTYEKLHCFVKRYSPEISCYDNRHINVSFVRAVYLVPQILSNNQQWCDKYQSLRSKGWNKDQDQNLRKKV